MIKYLILLFILILISACENYEYSSDTSNSTSKYELIHSFYDENDSLYAYVYGHSVEENIYDSVVITGLDRNFDDFIYEIKWNKLSNQEGVDLIGSSDFYGYKLKFEKEFFRIVMLDSIKEYTSDELTIHWNNSNKSFAIMKY